MAVDRRVWPAGEALLDLVYGLILGIPVAHRKLGPSSKLTTMDTATRAPPGQCGSGGEPAYPSRSRVLVPAWRICGIRWSSIGARWIIAYRWLKTTPTGGQSRRRATISLVQVEPAIFDRRRTRKA